MIELYGWITDLRAALSSTYACTRARDPGLNCVFSVTCGPGDAGRYPDMKLHYDLHDAGMGDGDRRIGDQKVQMTGLVPDSLRDLASAARALVMNGIEATFMDEPGEHQMIIRRINEEVDLEIMWYADWRGWKIAGPGQRRLSGRTTLADVRGQVLSQLRRLLDQNGESGYLQKWGEHPFPMTEMHDLEKLG